MHWQGSRFDSKLMALVINICSLLVVNVKGNITETDLLQLSSFSRLATVGASSRYTKLLEVDTRLIYFCVRPVH